eukprot:CAMPEP_0197636904 /NCGR_PEP_ID=MMETSP1338-20131121/12285_1 /TAXON_ID=43686 ORGANISM="Pelagodinium beii, Strain RCC1491" /NCGR_SAMPLE_ID=MMETSP1338 /ASSEMBLY_ACC=CAM_ASM_000754 /LENGTH=72 /DNA_ID=CAMNT_0043209235 /DNA_START=56 /DNA_END=272 /DNA_ORIENTATION=-
MAYVFAQLGEALEKSNAHMLRLLRGVHLQSEDSLSAIIPFFGEAAGGTGLSSMGIGSTGDREAADAGATGLS